MVRKIGNVLGIVRLAIVVSPLLAMAQEAAVPVVRMTQSPLSGGLIALAANLGRRHRSVRQRARSGPHGRIGNGIDRPQSKRSRPDFHPDAAGPGIHRSADPVRARDRIPAAAEDLKIRVIVCRRGPSGPVSFPLPRCRGYPCRRKFETHRGFQMRLRSSTPTALRALQNIEGRAALLALQQHIRRTRAPVCRSRGRECQHVTADRAMRQPSRRRMLQDGMPARRAQTPPMHDQHRRAALYAPTR